jgi:DMATS type aromatic prenyltransferase
MSDTAILAKRRYMLPSTHSLGSVGRVKLFSLCDALEMRGEAKPALQVFDALAQTWAARPVGEGPHCPSEISEDHSPFEFSLALGGVRPEVRMRAEAQGEGMDIRSHWDAAWQLNEHLLRTFGVVLSRARAVKDVFEPRDPGAHFGLWHAASLKPGGQPRFEVYFNAQAAGAERAADLVKEALRRLGFVRAWEFVHTHGMFRGHADQPIYFSVDLSAHSGAQVKVHIAHQNATAVEMERILASNPDHRPGEARRFCSAMAGSEGPFQAPPVTCMAFAARDDFQPAGISLHMPIRCYATHDLAAMKRISSYLWPEEAMRYQAAVMRMAGRRLGDGAGLHTVASFQRRDGLRRLSVSLSPEVYRAEAAERDMPEQPVRAGMPTRALLQCA